MKVFIYLFLQILTCIFHTWGKKAFPIFFSTFKVAEFLTDLLVLGTQTRFTNSRELIICF